MTTRCLRFLASRQSRLTALRFSHIPYTPATYSRPTIIQTGSQKCLFQTGRNTNDEPPDSVNEAESAANEDTARETKIRNSAASKSEQNESNLGELIQKRLSREELASLVTLLENGSLGSLLEKATSRNTAARPPQALAPQALPPSAWSTIPSKRRVQDVDIFKDGIKYRPPRPLLDTRGTEWAFQPHPNLYETLAPNVFEHYTLYKRNKVDKTDIPSYYYIGGAGTGKSRSASEFASSLRKAIEIEPYTQNPLYHELSRRLKTPFVFHVSFENGTPLMDDEFDNLWGAVGIRMLSQLLSEPLHTIRDKYIADPHTIFQLVAAAENVDFFDDFTGILVVDGAQNTITEANDGKSKGSAFYRLLTQISSLSLMKEEDPRTKETRAPFIMTCVTATQFGPPQNFLADSHRKRVYLPLKRLDPPTREKDNLPVFDIEKSSKRSSIIKLLLKDLGGHARAIELLAQLADYQNKSHLNITELANKVYDSLRDRYSEVLSDLTDDILPIVQCILSRQKIHIRGKIPGSERRWQEVTANGLIWFEPSSNLDAWGYLAAPYIWLWTLARQFSPDDDEPLFNFLSDWEFNDYAALLHLETGDGFPGNSTWQSFEAFCCAFRALQSLRFKDGEEVPLKVLHSGCKFSDNHGTIISRQLKIAEAAHQYTTRLAAGKPDTGMPWTAEEVKTRKHGILNADDQLSHIIRNGVSASAGDFFLNIKIPEKDRMGKIVREVGQCKLTPTKKITQKIYDKEWEKSAGPDDIFILYTSSDSDELVLPGRSGIVDASCWDHYFGPFAGRAYMASKSKKPTD